MAVGSGAPVVALSHLRATGSRPSPYEADLAYPVVRSRTAGAARMNRALKARARRLLAGFVHGLPPGPLPAGIPEKASTIQATAQTDILTSRLAGFRTLAYTFPAGAAHGLTVVTTATFNVRTGAEWHLAGIFKRGVDYLGFLSRESRILLRKQFSTRVAPPSMLDPGSAPKAANFTAWAVTPFGLEITFGDYQVGPYVIGTPSITIPFSSLSGLARPGGPIALAEAARPAQMALLPATIPPVVTECSKRAGPDESYPPATCPGGRVNVVSWNTFAAYSSAVLPLGPKPAAAAVLGAACRDQSRLRDPAAGRGAYAVAAAYYGWRFPRSPLAGYPRSCPHSG